MLITPRFLVLNIPKTGSTFVRTVLKEIEDRRPQRGWARFGLRRRAIRELYFRKRGSGAFAGVRDQHGAYCQVPARYRRLPVVTIARNPFDRYVSQYEFGLWRDHPAAPAERLLADFPAFPDLDFPAFLEYYHRAANDYLPPAERGPRELGYQARQLIEMIFTNPERAIREADAGWVGSSGFVRGLPEISFLRQERLNDTLCEFLIAHGYAPSEVEFVRDAPRIQPREGTRRGSADTWRNYYDASTARRVLERESLLFEIFEWFGIDYRTCGESLVP